jgi:hypothetical protein
MTDALQAKAAEAADYNILEGFTPQEIKVFGQYMYLVQSGWLEVAAVDRLGTDYKLELDEIKAIIKRGLKALQKARERAQKEALQRAKQNAKLEKRQQKQAARRKAQSKSSETFTQNGQGGWARRPLFDLVGGKTWLLLMALGLLLTGAGLALWLNFMSPSPSRPPPPPQETKILTIKKYYLRAGRVACFQQEDIEAITLVANQRLRYNAILGNGRCFVTSKEIPMEETAPVYRNIYRGINLETSQLLFFHQESLKIEEIDL